MEPVYVLLFFFFSALASLAIGNELVPFQFLMNVFLKYDKRMVLVFNSSMVKCLWLHDIMFSSMNIMFDVLFGIQSFQLWLASVIHWLLQMTLVVMLQCSNINVCMVL
jgi:hypothetical protein